MRPGNIVIVGSDRGKPVFEILAAIFEAIEAGREFCVVSSDQTENVEDLFGSQAIAPTPAEPTFQCMTSGSTTVPKIVRRSHRSWIRSFEINSRIWELGESDRYAVFSEFIHSLPLYALLEALYIGADFHVLYGVGPRRQLREIVSRKISVLYTTPTQLRLLAEAERGKETVIRSLRRVVVGGSKLDPVTATKIGRLFPNAEIHEFYGSSETSFISIGGPGAPIGSVGSSYPEVEISIRDDFGRRVPSGSAGEIWVRSPYLFKEYTAGVSANTARAGDYLSIGEIGRIDCGGNLFVIGRKDRMTTIAGQNAFPEEIEEFLLSVQGVVQAAVISEPNAIRGSSLAAFIMLGTELTASERIASECRSRFGMLKSPRKFISLNDWPTTRSGKTDYLKLERMLARANG